MGDKTQAILGTIFSAAGFGLSLSEAEQWIRLASGGLSILVALLTIVLIIKKLIKK